MSSVYMVSDNEIRSLAYLKSESKIAGYLGIDIERVAKAIPVPREPFIAASELLPQPLPEPVEEIAVQQPIEQVRVLTPCLCPTCGAPISGRLTVMHIQALVAAYYKIPFREMTSQRRHHGVAHPRQIAMYLAYELTPKSMPDIGGRFGGRDHTTVIHAIKQVQKRILADPEIDADVCALRERLAA